MANVNAVKEYLVDNMDVTRQVVSSLNSWNGCLEHLEVFDFDDDFFETFFAGKPMEAVRAWHFGGENNWSDEYIRFNGYDNLETLSEWKYNQELKDSIDEIVDLLIENQAHVSLDAELEELLSDDEESEDDEA